MFTYKSNLTKRSLATIIDYGIYLLFFVAYVIYFGQADRNGGMEVNGLMALPLLIFWFFYFIIVESIFGATPAHSAFGLKVLTIQRERIGFEQALKRHLLDCIDILFYGIPAFIIIKNTDKHQRIGDLWAKTIVVDVTDTEQFIDAKEQTKNNV